MSGSGNFDMARAIRPVTTEEQARFAADGVAMLEGFLDPETAARLAGEVDACLAPESGSGFKLGAGMIEHNALFNALVFESTVGEAAGRMMDAHRVRLYVDNLFVKAPCTDEPLNWHNDLPYYPFKAGRIMSIWIALEDVEPDMSPLQLIPGSHHWSRWFKPHIPSPAGAVKGRVENIDLEPCPDFSALDTQYPGAINIVGGAMRAGDAVAFTALTVHHSGANLSQDKRRIGYSLRFLAEDAIWDPRPNTLHETPGQVLTAGQPVDAFFPLIWSDDGTPCDSGMSFLSTAGQGNWKQSALTEA